MLLSLVPCFLKAAYADATAELQNKIRSQGLSPLQIQNIWAFRAERGERSNFTMQ